ncbi:MAG: indolepyruvate oxidoreductase subunit beta [archaeon]
MKFDLVLTGVGGEGVLTTGVMITKAAHEQGHYVRGVQLHGLAQRGGTIPTYIRFGDKEEIHSPSPMKSDADLIMSFEPIEAVRATEYARKDKTDFILNTYPYMPIYGNLENVPYPSIEEIKSRIKPFAKSIEVFKSDIIAKKKFGDIIYGNVLLVGAAISSGKLPIDEEVMKKSIEELVPRGKEKNLKAFELGLEMGKNK